MIQPHQPGKRGLAEVVADSDEWDDLPLVRRSGPAPIATNNHQAPGPSARTPLNHLQRPPPQKRQQQQRPRQWQQQQRQQQQRQQQNHHHQHPHQPRALPYQAPHNSPQQRKHGVSDVRATAVPQRSSSSTVPTPVLSHALTVSTPSSASTTMRRTTPAAGGAGVGAARTAGAATVAVVVPAKQNKKKDKEPTHCRRFMAGFCFAGPSCKDIHDGLKAEQEREAWLAGGPLPGPQPERWSMVVEAANKGGGPQGGLPGVATGTPPVLVIADIGTRGKATDFVCLAMETATGRQLGRFARFVRTSRKADTSPPVATSLPANQVAMPLALPSHQLPQFPPPQQQQLLQPPKHVAGVAVPELGASVAATEPTATTGVQGEVNPHSSALPLPDLLQELQQWMASLGLNPGPRDEAGFSERGNFRWVVTHGSGLPKIPDLIGQHKLQLPDHLRSWTDAARMCAWEADRQNARAAAAGLPVPHPDGRRQATSTSSKNSHSRVGAPGVGVGQKNGRGAGVPGKKQHSLPQSGLFGMLKFLGCPTEPEVPNRTRRGINTVETLAQCVMCMVRLGVPMPVTSRVTQTWEGAGGYVGSRHEELQVEQPPVVLSGAPVVLTGAVPAAVGAGAGSGAGAGGKPQPQHVRTLVGVGPTPQTKVNAADPGNVAGINAGAEKQGRKKKKKKKKENGGNNDNKSGVGTNGVVSMPQQEGPPLLGRHSQQQQQQQQQHVRSIPGGSGGSGQGAPQWQHGAQGGGSGGAGVAGGGGVAAGGGGRARAGQSAPRWRQNLPVNFLAPDYLDYFMREKERQFYKSAGILPYRRDPVSGEVRVLLGSEKRKDKLVVSCLAGKREDADAGPEHTAWREFWEESGKILGDNERATFLTACFEGRARAMWMQGAKMAVLACELSSPAFVSLPQSFASGAPGIDKSDTTMRALHWVSATELHHACHQRGGTVVVWGPPPPANQAPLKQQGVTVGQQQQDGQWKGMTGRQHPEPQAGMSKRQQKKLLAQQRKTGNSAGVGGVIGQVVQGAQGGHGGFSRPIQLPLPPQQHHQHQQQQQQQQQQRQLPSAPAPLVPTPVEPFPLLKTLVTDQAFQLFFAQLAAAGNSNQRFVPALNGTT